MDAPTVLRVLIVDESHEIADLTALFLQICGHSTAVAYDGAKAFDLAKTFCPNPVVLEINLPGMEGFELARRLRRLPGPTKPLLIAVTWRDGIDDMRRAKSFGLDHSFVKPVNPKEIVKVLAAMNPGGR
jgi:two-component system CheB/CheR fusion protein